MRLTKKEFDYSVENIESKFKKWHSNLKDCKLNELNFAFYALNQNEKVKLRGKFNIKAGKWPIKQEDLEVNKIKNCKKLKNKKSFKQLQIYTIDPYSIKKIIYPGNIEIEFIKNFFKSNYKTNELIDFLGRQKLSNGIIKKLLKISDFLPALILKIDSKILDYKYKIEHSNFLTQNFNDKFSMELKFWRYT